MTVPIPSHDPVGITLWRTGENAGEKLPNTVSDRYGGHQVVLGLGSRGDEVWTTTSGVTGDFTTLSTIHNPYEDNERRTRSQW
jgi:hypothetical protein